MPAIRGLNGDGGSTGVEMRGNTRVAGSIDSYSQRECCFLVKGFFLIVIGSGYLASECQSVTQQESNYRAVLMNLDFATGVQLFGVDLQDQQ